MVSYGQWLPFLLMTGLAASPVFAGDRCYSAATTDLERLYCDVVAEGGGASLPSQSDFNRNAPQVQALLLKRPAQRLGLTLPEATPPMNKHSAVESQSVQEPESEGPANRAPAPELGWGLASCTLNGTLIRCLDANYLLAENLEKSALEDGALGSDNRLEIEAFQGSREDRDAVLRYLSRAYDHYIPKMLRIGLGANTMSFTAFHNAFHILEESGVDFAGRMAQTYQLLKQDRQQLGVKSRYHDELPESLSLCGMINPDIIVCDNVGTNWIYVRNDG